MWWLSNGTHKYGMCETCRHLGCETKKKRYKSACGIDQMEDNIEDLTDYFGYWIWLGVSSVQAWSMGRCRVYRGSLFLTNSRDRYPAFGNKTCVCHVPHTCLRAKYTHFIATSRAWSSGNTVCWSQTILSTVSVIYFFSSYLHILRHQRAFDLPIILSTIDLTDKHWQTWEQFFELTLVWVTRPTKSGACQLACTFQDMLGWSVASSRPRRSCLAVSSFG